MVLAVAIVIATRPSSPGGPAGASAGASAGAGAAGSSPGPMSLADCQAAIAAQLNLPDRLTCGYETTGAWLPDNDPAADPSDPRYAGAALPTNLSTGGRACLTGSKRPVLDTIRPALSASFTAGPGLQRIESTFQVTGVDGPTGHDILIGGDNMPQGLTATLDFKMQGPLTHGESYRWRVRGTPPSVGAKGWSSWCEFTIGETTLDDLGLNPTRKYAITLPTAKWREALAILGPVETYTDGAKSKHAPIEVAATSSATTAPVTLSGYDWNSIVESLAYWASTEHKAAYWAVADLISAALDGPEHPTMGFPRA
ncbi:hypothetical protein Adu01nite_41420 [Paractinoplanes durhamensis]|uniref:Uncharacterized protein n=1 Tax=Paractinoplanes durhamensis TaxID=113563 RepID=A0ABQ3YZ06_9ACTN|nr:hypothetical protein Adu01nite_41420 [Actinoplanes durhamensis]